MQNEQKYNEEKKKACIVYWLYSADEDAPSAGLTLGIEDPDDSLDFANAMKDVDS